MKSEELREKNTDKRKNEQRLVGQSQEFYCNCHWNLGRKKEIRAIF